MRSLYALVLLLVIAGPLRGATYKITGITLGGTASEAHGINAAGTVVGWALPVGGADDRAFVFSGGVTTNLGTLGGNYSSAWAINASGIVVGQLNLAGNAVNRGFVAFGGVLAAIGTLGGTNSFARDINASGAIAGYSDTAGDATEHAFRLVGGTMQDLGSLAGSTEQSQGLGINDLGEVVGNTRVPGGGQHAFLFTTGGAMADLDTLGGTIAAANAVNNSSHSVGYSKTTGNAAAHAFLNVEGVTQDLGTLGGTTSEALDINSLDQIVGFAHTAGNVSHAFLYENGVMTDLNDLVVNPVDWILTYAYGINDSGLIVGQGKFQGKDRAFLLTPVVDGKAQPLPPVAPPSVRLSGKKRLVISRPRSVIRGTATGAVTRILYRTAGRKGYKTARGTTTWRISAKLKPGKNRFSVQAQGPGGFSNIAKVIIVRN